MTTGRRADNQRIRPEITVDARYPGGNIVFHGIRGSTVRIEQDLRDTVGYWFYWNFRVRGAAGRTLTFIFTTTRMARRLRDSCPPVNNPIGALGPAVSLDRGQTWKWLGARSAANGKFKFRFPKSAREVRFCLSIPYQAAHLQDFLSQSTPSPHLRIETLCKTPKGRSIELLRIGNMQSPRFRVLITARHHCCEMIASYVLEGVMRTILSRTALGKWLRDNVEFMIVPLVDKDGVEDGDQGKNRAPRDHNRDYSGRSVHPSTRALRRLVPRWSRRRMAVTIDLHCPYVRGDERIYMVGSRFRANWRQQRRFGAILQRSRRGTLPYRCADNLPFGKSWNTAAGYKGGKSFNQWASQLPGARMGTTFEIPYSHARGVPVTTDAARSFGRDLARALHLYLLTCRR